MLNSLRKQLTLICVVITGILLSATAVGLLFLSENQMDQQSEVTFQNNLNSVVYKIQSSPTLDSVWLSQLEAGNNLIVHIEDNGAPILFRGSWTPKTDRGELIDKTRQKAVDSYGFNLNSRPYSVIEVNSVSFQIEGNSNDRYQAAVASIPSAGDNWQSLTVLRDISAEQTQKLIMRLSFLGLIAVALSLLFLFSWWFAGRAIRPIEESRKKQVEFVAAASHELRSPLAVIQASISALARPEPSPKTLPAAPDTAQQVKFVDSANRECLRMAGLIDDLLFLASTDAGTWSVRTERIEPDTLMTELYECFEPIARKKSQRLSLTLPDDALSEISGDKQRLFQALSVLVNNALSYTPENGRIILDARQQRRALLLTVADNGPGIPDSQKNQVFDRFYRGDPSRNKKEHYGLGLAVAREIAELHGGSIAVTDTPGGGAAFTIRLPL